MMQVKDEVRRWLDEASTAMGGNAARRRDALLELESTILEQVDDRVSQGEGEQHAIQEVLVRMGNPQEIGASVLPPPVLLPAHATRPFLVQTAVLFAIHFLVILGATVAGTTLDLPVGAIAPLPRPPSVVAVFLRALETLVFDAGLMLFLFTALPRVRGLLQVPLRARANRRRNLDGALLMGLVLVVLNVLRDDLLALHVPGAAGTTRVPLVGPGLLANLMLLNLWIGLCLVRDMLYAYAGETRASLGLDVAGGLVGVFCLLRIVAAESLVDFSVARENLGANSAAIEALFNSTLVAVALVAAALIAGRTARRIFRFALLREELPGT